MDSTAVDSFGSGVCVPFVLLRCDLVVSLAALVFAILFSTAQVMTDAVRYSLVVVAMVVVAAKDG